ncbi:hypothetical protein Afe04nite_49060 [Asanoa ferruginea]|nr:hypothetical protein Afe04nite_49060 [Asanoa ferruginea]
MVAKGSRPARPNSSSAGERDDAAGEPQQTVNRGESVLFGHRVRRTGLRSYARFASYLQRVYVPTFTMLDRAGSIMESVNQPVVPPVAMRGWSRRQRGRGLEHILAEGAERDVGSQPRGGPTGSGAVR